MVLGLIKWVGLLLLTLFSAFAYSPSPKTTPSLFMAYWVVIALWVIKEELKEQLGAPILYASWGMAIIATFAAIRPL